MFLQKSVWIQEKKLDRSCLDCYYRKDPKVLVNNQYACGLFLDFQNAFDKVNHRILFN